MTSADAEPMLFAGDRVRTAAAIVERATQAAGGFAAIGIGEGDCIALLLRNDFAFFEASIAAGMVGAYPVPINWHGTADEAGYVLRDSAAKTLVIHADLLPGIAHAIPAGIALFVVDTPAEIAAAYGAGPSATLPAGAIRWDDWIGGQPRLENPDMTPRTAVIYTSGTTGKPKGVRRAADPGNVALGTAAIGYGLAEPRSRMVLMNGPMYHSAPNSYARIAFAGHASFVLQPRFDAEEMLALIERYRVTDMHVVPTMFVRLLRLPNDVRGRYDLSSLVHVVHGAAPCPPDVKLAMIDWWGPVIHEYYGASETGLITAHGSAEALAKRGTVGRPLPGVEVRILDDTGTPVTDGEIGGVYVRHRGPDFTYIGRDADRAEIEIDGYVTVGDVGRFDADGYLFLSDRARDMIISGGVNIYPAEIEAALLAIDGIGDCAVFGIPDEEFGEAVCAFVQPVAGATLDRADIRAQLEGKLSRFKIPRLIEFADTLPREDSGKIFKRKLREPYWRDA